MAYCNWRSQQEKRTLAYRIQNETVTLNNGATGYRLPTEAEWEYAAREGGKKVRFGNGSDVSKPSEINFDARALNKEPYSEAGTYRQKTVLVNELSTNELGLCQMSGNVQEWCWDWDWYDAYTQSNYTQSNGERNPLGPPEGKCRVLRGGSYLHPSRYCRVVSRSLREPSSGDTTVGVRLALPFAGR